MISIINYLFEVKTEKKDPTKLGTGEKIAGGLGIAGGASLYGVGKVGENVRDEIMKNPEFREKMKKSINDQKEMLVKQGHDPDQIDEIQKKTIVSLKKLPDTLENTGLAVAGTIGAGLAAHKLYKMYKNKKK